jgi:hypothetical protein
MVVRVISQTRRARCHGGLGAYSSGEDVSALEAGSTVLTVQQHTDRVLRDHGNIEGDVEGAVVGVSFSLTVS